MGLQNLNEVLCAQSDAKPVRIALACDRVPDQIAWAWFIGSMSRTPNDEQGSYSGMKSPDLLSRSTSLLSARIRRKSATDRLDSAIAKYAKHSAELVQACAPDDTNSGSMAKCVAVGRAAVSVPGSRACRLHHPEAVGRNLARGGPVNPPNHPSSQSRPASRA